MTRRGRLAGMLVALASAASVWTFAPAVAHAASAGLLAMAGYNGEGEQGVGTTTSLDVFHAVPAWGW